MIRFDTENDVFTFGKYKGKSIKEVLKTNPQYVVWVIENVKNTFIHESILVQVNLYSIINAGKKRYKSKRASFWVHDPEQDADFASAFDWGSQ